MAAGDESEGVAVKTLIITLPPDSEADQILVRDSEVDVRKNFGVWTPIVLTGGSVEEVS
jgi:hypothetical protein